MLTEIDCLTEASVKSLQIDFHTLVNRVETNNGFLED